METKKFKGHFTQVPNKLLDALCRIKLPQQEMQVVHAIIRLTFGWTFKCNNQYQAVITPAMIKEQTGLAKGHEWRARNALLKKNIIIQNGNYIGINPEIERWEGITGKKQKELKTEDSASNPTGLQKWDKMVYQSDPTGIPRADENEDYNNALQPTKQKKENKIVIDNQPKIKGKEPDKTYQQLIEQWNKYAPSDLTCRSIDRKDSLEIKRCLEKIQPYTIGDVVDVIPKWFDDNYCDRFLQSIRPSLSLLAWMKIQDCSVVRRMIQQKKGEAKSDFNILAEKTRKRMQESHY